MNHSDFNISNTELMRYNWGYTWYMNAVYTYITNNIMIWVCLKIGNTRKYAFFTKNIGT